MDDIFDKFIELARPKPDANGHLSDLDVHAWGTGSEGTLGMADGVGDSMEFVIPDAFMNLAVHALAAAGHSICVNRDCEVNHLPIDQQPATVHYDFVKDSKIWGPLRLYTKSSIIWWVPDPTPTLPIADDAHYMLTNNPRLPPKSPLPHDGPGGPYTDLYTVRIEAECLYRGRAFALLSRLSACQYLRRLLGGVTRSYE
ncbi:hypothetical protein N7492_006985 [Penicillium capsulatum]|uniref:Uncharacterized protein n=1 Tax=Penicillium capsulatum TaxID=69766 RepID=A0A9W9I176_9EURO|nr:hypothetical protein N7492_006985 [Penicillium capsulatum]KAJ6116818.1 hypothetical protein N7512_006543 [Penicillium capsulatum]